MASNFIFANFFETELLEDISTAATTIHVTPSIAAKLPVISPGFSQARLVLWDGVHSPEIVNVIDNPQTGFMTAERAQEGTTARPWPAGTQVACTLTAEIINSALQAYIDAGVLLSMNYLHLSGGTLTGPLTLSADPVNLLEPATKQYTDSVLGDKLPLNGGTMLGSINMNGQRLINIPPPIASTEPVRKAEFDANNTANLNNLNNNNANLVTSGTSIAFTLAILGTPISVLVDGMTVSARIHTTNDANPTLSYSLTPATAIQLLPGIAVPEKHMQAGQAYDFIYTGGVWLLKGSLRSNIRNRPGDIKWSFLTADHDDCLLCNGRSLLRTQYPTLFANIGAMFGAVDGAHFNLPDQSGKALVGRDVTGVVSLAFNTTTTAGLNTASVASAAGLAIGMFISCPNFVLGTTILNIVGTTITLSNLATANGTVLAKFSPFTDATFTGATGGQFTHTQDRKEVGQHLHANTVGETAHTHTINQLAGATMITTNGGPVAFAGGAFASISSALAISLNVAVAGVNITNVDSASPLPMGLTQPSLLGNMFIYAY